MRPFGRSSWRWAISEINMNILLFNGFLLLGFVVATDILVLGSPGPTQIVDRDPSVKKCRYNRANRASMLEAVCTNLELHDIPTNLKEDIEVLDATVNRLRDLKNDSLASYKNLAFIYLGDNFIQNIEEGAFAKQQYLQVLDLSENGCDTLPKSLFQLPYLRTLYLGHNKLTDSIFKVEVTSPIQLLQLTKNKLTKIPYIGLQPTLITLNVSENYITSIDVEDLAPFCSLKFLDLSQNAIKFNSVGCECQTLDAWVKLRQIKMKPELNCTNSPIEDCTNVQFSNRTYELYNECSTIIQQKVETEKARSVWILVVSCVAVFLLVIFMVLFCVHKRNRRRRRKQKEQQQLAVNNANTELLNSNLTGNS